MQKKPFIIGFTSCLLLVGLVLFIGFLFLKNERAEMLLEDNSKEVENINYSIININKKDISNLSLYDLNGKKITFDKERVIFLNFWATWCMPCIAEMPSIKELSKSKDFNNGFVGFVLATDDSKDRVVKFEEKKQFNFNYATFKKGSLPKVINHNLIPTTYLIDIENLICYKFEGSVNYNSVLFKKFLLTLK